MWELVKLPQCQKIIECKWVSKKKEEIPDVEVARFKVCLVAKSYSQNEGIDFDKVFSPIMEHSSICMLLTIVVLFDLEFE